MTTGIYGTNNDDTLTGTTGVDLLKGYAGNDSLSALDGNDTLDGGLGDDALDGGAGIDTATYATASGSVTVDLWDGTASGADGHDTLTSIENVVGSAYDDTIIGGTGPNHLSGGAGNDYFEVRSSAYGYVFDGGAGIDTVSYANTAGGGIYLDDANYVSIENVVGSEFRDRIGGTAGDNVIHAGGGDDIIINGGGSDQVYGEAGDDTLYLTTDASLPAGNVLFDGGTGNDMLSFENSPVGVTINLGLEGVAQSLGAVGTITVNSVEDLIATPFDDVITGNDSDNQIWSGTGNDTVAGGGGNDLLTVDTGNKVIDGGAGNDTVQFTSDLSLGTADRNLTISLRISTAQTVTPGIEWTLTNVENLTGWYGNDHLTGNSADNVLDGGGGDDVLWGFGGNDTLIGGTGNDTARYSMATAAVQVDLGAGTATGGDGYDTLSGIENVIGSSYNDRLYGDSGANTIDGGAGADYMRGQTGNDTYIVDNVGDQVIEGSNAGTDTVKSSVSYTITGYVENLTLTGTASIDGTGNGLANVLTGNSGVNVLTGGAGNDTYVIQTVGDQVVEAASGGTDTVQSHLSSYTLADNVENLTLMGSAKYGTGNALNNVIVGDAGANVLDGGAGADNLQGGTGNDIYIVDNTGDRITEPQSAYSSDPAYGGTDLVQSSVSWRLGIGLENLTLTGTAAINGTGNSYDNVIIGNSAANIIDGGGGNDTMRGGDGNDTYVVDSAGDRIIETSSGGTDTARSWLADYTLSSYVENLVLMGTGNINGTGNAGANTITGNSGSNIIDGGRGADIMKGGLGDDIYHVDNVGDRVIEASGVGFDQVISTVSYTLGNYVEGLTLAGTANINATGNAQDNQLIGNSGDNILDGGAGADIMVGGAGNDTYVMDSDSDTISESAGNGIDTIMSSVSMSLDYSMTLNVENLTLTGTAAIDAIGNSGDNVLIGNSAANVLDGSYGDDIMKGGGGNDTYIVWDAGDQVVEGANAGVDTVDASVNYALTANVENLNLWGSGLTGIGNDLANTITGTSDNVLDGGAGADTLIGGDGNNTFIIDNVGDRIIEAAPYGDDNVISSVSFTLGSNLENLVLTGTSAIDGTGNSLDNVIFGNDAANTLTGAGGNDYLDGAGGNDTLSGGAGSDILIGGAGNDVLTGGTDADVFGFDAALGSTNVDTITDFSPSDDTIVLSQAIFSALPLDYLPTTAFQAGTSANDAGDRIIYDKSTGSIYYDADGNGSGAKILFAKVAAGTNLTASNFYVVDVTTMTAWSGKTSAAQAAHASTAEASPSADLHVPHANPAWAVFADHSDQFGMDLHPTCMATDSGLL